jgi:hypothetical protein
MDVARATVVVPAPSFGSSMCEISADIQSGEFIHVCVNNLEISDVPRPPVSTLIPGAPQDAVKTTVNRAGRVVKRMRDSFVSVAGTDTVAPSFRN